MLCKNMFQQIAGVSSLTLNDPFPDLTLIAVICQDEMKTCFEQIIPFFHDSFFEASSSVDTFCP